MNCFAFQLIQKEILAFKVILQHEKSFAHENVSSLSLAKMEIEAMLRGVA